MAMNLSDPKTLNLLPVYMRSDEANVALADIVDELIKDPGSRVEQLRVWDKIDSLPEKMLDELAWEMNIDWYKATSMSIEAKRATIKNARLIKAHRGTNFAVESLIDSYLGDASLLEWWDFNGRPFTFYILVTSDIEDQSKFNEFIEAVKAGKNARSRMLGIYAYMEHEDSVKCSISGGCGVLVYLRPGTHPHVMWIGETPEITAEALTESQMLHIDYTSPSEGRLGRLVQGNEPHVSNIGNASERSSGADIESQTVEMRYPIAGMSICGFN